MHYQNNHNLNKYFKIKKRKILEVFKILKVKDQQKKLVLYLMRKKLQEIFLKDFLKINNKNFKYY